jgi:hypothetical protein
MTPKEKAIELYNKMYDFSIFDESAKQCALIAVDEIMSALTYLRYGLDYLNKICYWEEVKQEIEAL